MMKAMILAAGLGTRLRPLTDNIPKALVPIEGRPLLALQLDRLKGAGADDITVNVHHFADSIVRFIHCYDAHGIKLRLSCESDAPLDTGGGIRRAFIGGSDLPVLVHNVDILSNADLSGLYMQCRGDADALLLVSARPTRRYLLFDDDMRLTGWTDIATGEVRSPYIGFDPHRYRRLAFAGIHVVAPKAITVMKEWPEKFPIIDFYIRNSRRLNVRGVVQSDLKLLDVGKPDTLKRAGEFMKEAGI